MRFKNYSKHHKTIIATCYGMLALGALLIAHKITNQKDASDVTLKTVCSTVAAAALTTKTRWSARKQNEQRKQRRLVRKFHRGRRRFFHHKRQRS